MLDYVVNLYWNNRALRQPSHELIVRISPGAPLLYGQHLTVKPADMYPLHAGQRMLSRYGKHVRLRYQQLRCQPLIDDRWAHETDVELFVQERATLRLRTQLLQGEMN